MNAYGSWMLAAYLSAGAIILIRGQRRGIPRERVLRFLVWFLAGAYLGAQLAGVLVTLWAGGGFVLPLMSGSTGASWGGIAGGIGAGFLATSTAQQERAVLFHAGILAAPTSQMLGRFGCYSVGCCHGAQIPEASTQWAVVYSRNPWVEPHLLSLPLYPVQMYEALGCLVIGAVLWITLPAASLRRTAVTYVTAYAVLRLAMETMRGDSNRGFFAGWSSAQVLATAWLVGFIAVWLTRRPSRRGVQRAPDPHPRRIAATES